MSLAYATAGMLTPSKFSYLFTSESPIYSFMQTPVVRKVKEGIQAVGSRVRVAMARG